MEQTSGGEQICGVSREIIEEFLVLVRDNYRKADRASYFMEEHGHVMNTAAVANLRDILSHLATLLDPKTAPEHHRAQIENAEEHLRRAILEPYLIVLGRDRREFRILFEQYENQLLPLKPKYPSLSGAPGADFVRARMREIAKLASSARFRNIRLRRQPANRRQFKQLCCGSTPSIHEGR